MDDAHETTPANDWALDLVRVGDLAAELIDQRAADKANAAYVASNVHWARVADEVYAWNQAKTYIAAIICGLLAKSTDEEANPLSLQVTNPSGGGYNAAGVWQRFYGQAQGQIDMKKLKGVPFNNSPFTGKRFISTDWQNVARANVPRLQRTVDLLNEVATMSSTEAKSALRSFLYAVPDHAMFGDLNASVTYGGLNLQAMFVGVENFLLDNAENGRRGQAFVAACLAVVHGRKDIDTPESINDPSRTLAGDVRVIASEALGKKHFAEAKQKTVRPADVHNFAKEASDKGAGGTAGYAALVNSRDSARKAGLAELPGWREILADEDVLMGVWTSPSDLLHQAIVWSGRPVDAAVASFSSLYASFLARVGVDPGTVEAWREVARGFGVELTDES